MVLSHLFIKRNNRDMLVQVTKKNVFQNAFKVSDIIVNIFTI